MQAIVAFNFPTVKLLQCFKNESAAPFQHTVFTVLSHRRRDSAKEADLLGLS